MAKIPVQFLPCKHTTEMTRSAIIDNGGAEQLDQFDGGEIELITFRSADCPACDEAEVEAGCRQTGVILDHRPPRAQFTGDHIALTYLALLR